MTVDLPPYFENFLSYKIAINQQLFTTTTAPSPQARDRSQQNRSLYSTYFIDYKTNTLRLHRSHIRWSIEFHRSPTSSCSAVQLPNYALCKQMMPQIESANNDAWDRDADDKWTWEFEMIGAVGLRNRAQIVVFCRFFLNTLQVGRQWLAAKNSCISGVDPRNPVCSGLQDLKRRCR